MKRILSFVITVIIGVTAFAQGTIQVKAGKPAGNIDPMLYGQLFEHIYFSANNGVWQELIYERSFEPEHYPGIPPEMAGVPPARPALERRPAGPALRVQGPGGRVGFLLPAAL